MKIQCKTSYETFFGYAVNLPRNKCYLLSELGLIN